MITVLILSDAGDLLYQSGQFNRHQPNEGSIIRFLPLLLTKDLFKANFHDRIHYVHNRSKTIAFIERHGLLYIAYTRRGSIPVNALHRHLHVIDRLLLFTFGPQWYTKVDTLTASRTLRWQGSLSATAIASCLSRLPFLAAPLPPLYSPDMLCCVEQVELQEDLRSRLTDNLRDCCNAAFAHSQAAAAAAALRFTSLFATPPRKILTLSALKQHHSLHDTQQHPQMWSDAFIFAKDKLVVRCSRVDDDLPHEDIPSETLYFLKSMASEYADQAAAREDIAEQRNRPSASSSKSHHPDANSSISLDRKKAYVTSSDSSPTPQPSSSEATSQKSSTSYIYDSSSVSAPFKVRKKSTSSVTVASSNCSTPSLSWSSPPILMHNYLLSRLSRRSMDVDDRPEGLRRLSSSSRHTDNQATTLPRNATIFHPPITIVNGNEPETTNDAVLSSSVPLEITTFGLSKPTMRQSAPTSPGPRSRRDGSADRLSARTSLRNMFSTFLQAEQVDDEVAPNEGKILSRWVRFSHDNLILCVILLVHLGDGLCATVVFRDDQQERDDDTPDVTSDRMTSHGSVKTFRAKLQDYLKDYTSFLMTKVATHFSILSFITVYPGVLHFIHTHNGVMLSPRIIDLTHLNQDHELLLEIGQKYQEWNSCTACELTPKWGWPSIGKLQNLVEEMTRLSRPSGSRECKIVEMSHQGFQCAYLRGYDGEYLLAMYFSFIPPHVVLEMHERLFQDLNQRSLLAA